MNRQADISIVDKQEFFEAYVSAMVFANTEEGKYWNPADFMGQKFVLTDEIRSKIAPDDMMEMIADCQKFLLKATSFNKQKAI